MPVLWATCGYGGCSKESEACDYAVQLGAPALEQAPDVRAGDVRGPSRAEDGEDVVIGGALELDEAQRAHRRSMLLHEQADQVTEGLAGLALTDLLGLWVLAEARPRADLSRGLARSGQGKVPDAADGV